MGEIAIGDIIAGLSGAGLTALLGYFTVVRKAKTDETSIALSAWKELIEPMSEQLRDAKHQIAGLRQEADARQRKHEQEVADLMKQIQELREELAQYKHLK